MRIMRMLQNLYIYVAILAVPCVQSTGETQAHREFGCESVRTKFSSATGSHGFNVDPLNTRMGGQGSAVVVNNSEIVAHVIPSSKFLAENQQFPLKKIIGALLRVCHADLTCCTAHMEDSLVSRANQEINRSLSGRIHATQLTFSSDATKFDLFFLSLLDRAKRELHAHFVRLYGLLYQQNSHVFLHLFTGLRAYHVSGGPAINVTLHRFFTALWRRMFELFNAQHAFDDAYLECVGTRLDEVKPFGAVPQRLGVRVRRVFGAARAFVIGLTAGHEVLHTAHKLGLAPGCSGAVTRLLYCPYCRGVADAVPCRHACHRVISDCVTPSAPLAPHWATYIGELSRLAGKLEGAYNIEMVVGPLVERISDAIFNFQENVNDISAQVFRACGEPKYDDRRKRSAVERKSSKLKKDRKPTTEHPFRQTTPGTPGPSLDFLVRSIHANVRGARDLWKGVGGVVCAEWGAGGSEGEEGCWDGHRVSRHAVPMGSNGSVPTIPYGVTAAGAGVEGARGVVMSAQLLGAVSSNLRGAALGHDVNWTLSADDYDDGAEYDYDELDDASEDPAGTNWDEEEYEIKEEFEPSDTITPQAVSLLPLSISHPVYTIRPTDVPQQDLVNINRPMTEDTVQFVAPLVSGSLCRISFRVSAIAVCLLSVCVFL